MCKSLAGPRTLLLPAYEPHSMIFIMADVPGSNHILTFAFTADVHLGT